MVSPEQLKTFFASPGWHYVEERMKEWQESYLRDLLAETDLHEVLRIQARLQQLDAMLRIRARLWKTWIRTFNRNLTGANHG